jgi:hypothetical protein
LVLGVEPSSSLLVTSVTPWTNWARWPGGALDADARTVSLFAPEHRLFVGVGDSVTDRVVTTYAAGAPRCPRVFVVELRVGGHGTFPQSLPPAPVPGPSCAPAASASTPHRARELSGDAPAPEAPSSSQRSPLVVAVPAALAGLLLLGVGLAIRSSRRKRRVVTESQSFELDDSEAQLA